MTVWQKPHLPEVVLSDVMVQHRSIFRMMHMLSPYMYVRYEENHLFTTPM
jgi:hypothetical protein